MTPIPPASSEHTTKQIAIAIQLFYTVPWHQDCYFGILQYAERQGWHCVVDPHLIGIGPAFDPSVYDGVVGRLEDSTAKIVEELGIPTVNHRLAYQPEDEARVKKLPSVWPDKYRGGQMAAEHLISSGYRRFGFVGYQSHIDKSLDGLRDAVASHQLGPVDSIAIDGHFDDTRELSIKVHRQLTAWLSERVTPAGIITLHYGSARFLAQACLEMGLRVPEDIGIICIDGDKLIVSSASPSLSAMEFDHFEVGYKAAALLDKIMKGEPASPRHQLVAPTRLIVRESSDVFLCEDPLVSQAMRYIAEHIRQNPTLDEIAEAVGASRRTLHRHFDDALGRPVTEEIARLRTEYIQRLLLETGLPIVRIASDCGFSSQSYLTHFFRKQTGDTPGGYRKRYQR